MKIGGMKAAIEGQCIDTEIMLAAMTCDEKRALIEAARRSIENWNRLVKLNKTESPTWADVDSQWTDKEQDQ